MQNLRYLLTGVMTATLAFSVDIPVCGADLLVVKRETAGALGKAVAGERNAAAAGCTFYPAPILAPGKPAWITVLDRVGQPVAGVSLLVNGQPCNSDVQGTVWFTVPEEPTVSLALVGSENQAVQISEYVRVKDLLVRTGWSATVRKLLDLNTASAPVTSIWLAPVVIEPGQVSCLLGSGFAVAPSDAAVAGSSASGLSTSENERVCIDGLMAQTLSGSPHAVVFRASANQLLGPMKTLFATAANGLATNALEVDVAKANLLVDQTTAVGTDTIPATISVSGTNMPVLVELSDKVENGSVDRRLLVLQGGEANQAQANLSAGQVRDMNCSAHLLGEALPLRSGVSELITARILADAQSCRRAQLVRLNRRLVSVEYRLLENRQQIYQQAIGQPQMIAPVSALAPASDLAENLQAASRALAVRRLSLSEMIAGLRACYLAGGASDDDVRLAQNDATGGAYSNLEQNDRSAQLLSTLAIPAAGAGVANASATPVSFSVGNGTQLMPPPPMRPGKLLAEPRMILLPPLSMVVESSLTSPASARAPLSAQAALPGAGSAAVVAAVVRDKDLFGPFLKAVRATDSGDKTKVNGTKLNDKSCGKDKGNEDSIKAPAKGSLQTGKQKADRRGKASDLSISGTGRGKRLNRRSRKHHSRDVGASSNISSRHGRHHRRR